MNIDINTLRSDLRILDRNELWLKRVRFASWLHIGGRAGRLCSVHLSGVKIDQVGKELINEIMLHVYFVT